MSERRISYTLRFKKETLIQLENNGGNVRRTATDMKVLRTCVGRWKKERAMIFKATEYTDSSDEDTFIKTDL